MFPATHPAATRNVPKLRLAGQMPLPGVPAPGPLPMRQQLRGRRPIVIKLDGMGVRERPRYSLNSQRGTNATPLGHRSNRELVAGFRGTTVALGELFNQLANDAMTAQDFADAQNDARLVLLRSQAIFATVMRRAEEAVGGSVHIVEVDGWGDIGWKV